MTILLKIAAPVFLVAATVIATQGTAPGTVAGGSPATDGRCCCQLVCECASCPGADCDQCECQAVCQCDACECKLDTCAAACCADGENPCCSGGCCPTAGDGHPGDSECEADDTVS